MNKKEIIKKLQKKPDRYWKVQLFEEKGFQRKQCKNCGQYFWTLTDQDTCNDSICRPYEFIGNSPTKEKLDYFQVWGRIKDFFQRRGHAVLKPYPVVCRWFPLYFTVAGIVDFYRQEDSGLGFEFPDNPTILTQPCLRFNDLPNVGINGKSYTSFLMIQQSALQGREGGYWKDRCIELDYKLLTEVFGIDPEEIAFTEDAWVGPRAFGSSLEYHVMGLELGNAVFTEFVGTPGNYREMENKVIDMGAGHERFAWLSQGTATSYESTFGPVLQKLKKRCGVRYDEKFFQNYSRLSGRLNLDEVSDLREEKKKIAQELDLSLEELKKKTAPIEALYTIADHSRTLLLGIADGGIPSNVAGGYNLRVVLRRALDLIQENDFPLSLDEIISWHADYLEKLFPRVAENREKIREIISLEKEKYQKTKAKTRAVVENLSQKKKKITEKEALEYYDSEGITPEQLRKAGLEVETSEDFYAKAAERHQKTGEPEPEETKPDLPETELIFYEHPDQETLEAEVLSVQGKKVVLDRTIFYPESGGQLYDQGEINGSPVTKVEEKSGVVYHTLRGKTPKKGEKITGKIDIERRKQLIQHHTAVHLINGVTTKILGDHIWQAGSRKTREKATLDVTHYRSFSEEELERIEDRANKIIQEGLEVKKHHMDRSEAEKKFGFRLYQGGIPKQRRLRIIEIPDIDVEACGGLHVDNTRRLERVVVVGSESVQDGVNRITLKAGEAADKHLEKSLNRSRKILESLREMPFLKISKKLKEKLEDENQAFKEIRRASKVFDVGEGEVKKTLDRFGKEIVQFQKTINRLEGGKKEMSIMIKGARSLEGLSQRVFETWKDQKKKTEKVRESFAQLQAQQLIKKAKKGKIVEIISGDRQDLIQIADAIMEEKPNFTVVLANQSGDVVGMSREEDMEELVGEICRRAGGKSGGRKDFAQGKGELSKLLRIIEEYK